MEYMTFEEGESRYIVQYDEDHETRGSYVYGTEEETRAAEDEEIERLNTGEWVCLFAQRGHICKECGQWVSDDSCGGIVVENDEEKVRAHVLELLGWE